MIVKSSAFTRKCKDVLTLVLQCLIIDNKKVKLAIHLKDIGVYPKVKQLRRVPAVSETLAVL